MEAFRKFDPRTFLADLENEEGTSAKVAKAAKVLRPAEPSFGAPPPRSPAPIGGLESFNAGLHERAAIIEHEAGVPLVWAEGYARLQSMPPPTDMPLQRWWRFIDDAGRFLDSGWAVRAAALGWAAEDLFGLDTTSLVFLLDGGTLVALASDKAVIRMPTGSTRTYCRDPDRRGVAAWALAPTDDRGPTIAATSGFIIE